MKDRPSTSSVHFLRDKTQKKKIRIEINKDNIQKQNMEPNHQESMSLLFYDFNS